MLDPVDVDALVTEVASGNFEDARLTRRLEKLVRALAENPSASLPSILGSAALEGAYRFMSNERVSPEGILGPHLGMTRARVALEPRVRIVHDTTDICYRHDGRRTGFGEGRVYQSFFAHLSLAVSSDPSRKPLGIAGVDTWLAGERNRKQSCWLSQIKASEKMLGCGTKAIHICDRAADDYALLAELIECDHRFVIRSSVDRWTNNGPDDSRLKLHQVLATIEHVSEREASINRRRREGEARRRKIHPPREARTVKLHLAATAVQLVRPANYGSKNQGALKDLPKTLSVNVVRVWEPEPPEGAEPVEWFLFTNEPIATPDDVCAIVDHYRARWVIEEYFKALKTGCAFEKRQLQDYESLLNALAIFAPIAYHVLLLRTLARHEPDAPASTVASPEQLEVLRAMGRRPLPEKPTARDVLLCIAALGGHIKYAPDPGWLTIARGFEKLEAYTAAWAAAEASLAAAGRLKIPLPSDQR